MRGLPDAPPNKLQGYRQEEVGVLPDAPLIECMANTRKGWGGLSDAPARDNAGKGWGAGCPRPPIMKNGRAARVFFLVLWPKLRLVPKENDAVRTLI